MERQPHRLQVSIVKRVQPDNTERPVEYFDGGNVDDLQELRDQYLLWSEENRSFLSRAGFARGQDLVDLGCGPGFTTLDLVDVVGPGGKVLAIDKDEKQSLSHLRKQLHDHRIANVEIHAEDLSTFTLAEKSVDGIYCRWTLMYVPESDVRELVNRMVDWLRPKGVCAITEICNFRDMRISPASDYLVPITEALMTYIRAEWGSNPEIGNLLPDLLGHAGFKIEFKEVTKVVRSGTRGWVWPDKMFRDIVPLLIRKGFLEEKTAAAFLCEWRERSVDPESLFFGSPMMEITGILKE